ncbi:MAG: hypothetical protein HQM10_12925 [Candidatus Riflebacteria bacterium]|nr:hypothetical protein [Candidatus Riflebacteria bacterium]
MKPVCIFFLMLCFFLSPTSVSADIASFSIVLSDEGVKAIFQYPVSIDKVIIPVYNAMLWGADRTGQSLVVISKDESAVGVRNASESFIEVRINTNFCREIEIIPLLSNTGKPELDYTKPVEKSSLKNNAEWSFIGDHSERRMIEKAISNAATKVLLRQKHNKCFSCHEIIPLAILCSAADDFEYQLPDSILAEICRNIISYQDFDGSFCFNASWYKDRTASTLAAGFFLALNCRWNPRVGEALMKAARYINPVQRADGRIETAFSFPPYFTGSLFSTWLAMEIFSFAEKYHFMLTLSESSEFASPLKNSKTYLFNKLPVLFDRLDETSLSVPYSGDIEEASLTRHIELSYSKSDDLLNSELFQKTMLSYKLTRLGGKPCNRTQQVPSEAESSSTVTNILNTTLAILSSIQWHQPSSAQLQ